MKHKKTIIEIVLTSIAISPLLISSSDGCLRCEKAIRTPDFLTPEYRTFDNRDLIISVRNGTSTASAMIFELSREEILNGASVIINPTERTS